MTVLIAEFDSAAAVLAAAQGQPPCGVRLVDACTSQPVEGLAEALSLPTPHLRRTMLIFGTLAAAALYALEWWSAVIDYPLNLGGRPLNSWSAFLLPAFEIGVLAAAIAGVAAFIHGSGLPRLHHPLFAVPIFERASQDRFLLIVEAEDSSAGESWLGAQGARSVQRAEP